MGGYRKPLQRLLPYGMLATKKWLHAQGLSTHALDNAVKTEVLLKLAPGVYSQYTKKLRWQGVISSIQRMDETDVPAVHVGGLTALALEGLSQYVVLGGQKVHLYSRSKLPAWLSRLSLSIEFNGHGVRTLWSEAVMSNVKYVRKLEWEEGLPPVYYSCPEKAIMEVLASVPDSISFEHADELMQGLVNLSPRKLEALLKECCNIRVKRLFFWFAKRQSYPWFKKLDVEDYDLGSGKRVVAKNGMLDKDYLITVPRHMSESK